MNNTHEERMKFFDTKDCNKRKTIPFLCIYNNNPKPNNMAVVHATNENEAEDIFRRSYLAHLSKDAKANVKIINMELIAEIF